MYHLINQMFGVVNRAQLNKGEVQLGYITSVDASGYNVKVMLQPEEVETGFIPYCTPVYGWVAPPSGGELAVVLFQGGKKNVPIAAQLIYWDGGRAPGVSGAGDTAAGEMLLKHSSGSYIKLSNDGKVLINGQTEIDTTAQTLNINTTGNVNITSGNNVSVSAANSASVTANNVTFGNGVSAADYLVKLNALLSAFNAHVHTDPQGGSTGTPTVPLTSAIGTTVMRGA